MPTLRLGTSSFSEPTWVGPFYPKGTKPADYLAYYATRYNTVEIDATYYAVPSASTVDGWHGKTPARFCFAAKFPRTIVHGGEAATPNAKIILNPKITYPIRDQFLDVMSRLGKKLGPLLLQFPYFSKSVYSSPTEFHDRLDTFLADLPSAFRYAVEIRNRSWLTPKFVELLKTHNVALTLVDQAWMPHADELPSKIDPVTTDFSYIRLLGDRKEIEAITQTWDKEVIDRTERLKRWAEFIPKIIARDFNVFAYINNHYAGHAPTTLEKLNALIEERS